MVDHSKNLMIGLFVAVALAIIIFIILFIHPTVGDEGSTLSVRFANIDKVNVGTRVTFGGRAVGEVIEIKEIVNEAAPRQSHDGRVYVYELLLAIDSSIVVYNSDAIALQTSGLLGERSVNITPLPPEKGVQLRVVNKEIIYAKEGGSLEDALKELQNLSSKIDKALASAGRLLDSAEKEQLIPHIAHTFANLEDISGALNKPESWSLMLNNFEKFSNTLGDVSEGKGTVGKLLKSDELYLRTTSLFSKAETAMNDVNHYGILFHLDKNWQRVRARRVNLLSKLRTPQEFRNYFNDEIDQISTSLSRVSMVLGSQGCTRMAPCLVQDFEFSKVFAELLRRVEQVEEELKLYNIQLVEEAVDQTELGCTPCSNR